VSRLYRIGATHVFSAHFPIFAIMVPDAEMASLGFNPWVGHLGTWEFSWGRSQRNCTLANSKQSPGTPLPISPRWLECVDDELSALAVKTLSLQIRYLVVWNPLILMGLHLTLHVIGLDKAATSPAAAPAVGPSLFQGDPFSNFTTRR